MFYCNKTYDKEEFRNFKNIFFINIIIWLPYFAFINPLSNFRNRCIKNLSFIFLSRKWNMVALFFIFSTGIKREVFLLKTSQLLDAHAHTHTHRHSATKLENLTSFLTQPQRVLCLPGNPGNPAAAWPCSLVKHSLRVKVKVFNHMSSLDLTWVRRCAGLGARCPVGFFDSCRTWLINVAPTSPPPFLCCSRRTTA